MERALLAHPHRPRVPHQGQCAPEGHRSCWHWATDADARAARAEPGPTIPLAGVLAKYGDDLAAFPDER